MICAATFNYRNVLDSTSELAGGKGAAGKLCAEKAVEIYLQRKHAPCKADRVLVANRLRPIGTALNLRTTAVHKCALV